MTYFSIPQVVLLLRPLRRVDVYNQRSAPDTPRLNFLQTYSNQFFIFVSSQSSLSHTINFEDFLYRYGYMAFITRLEERYVIKSALDRLARSLFGSNFNVNV